ncbi:MAG: hypothetical protein P0Y53_17535 [Candidatus Pseudobacter hemicellulosilyticus]|uniref:Lipoprotein n=1 Tax=Candidatus Pseudobacter hemicellulosilyticus TaxID=3121375 RepID=A0AAJ5WP35_9BACT|nr:MAG: hypothetical protein P0Y53_17535 [Pseudobacter sp.]
MTRWLILALVALIGSCAKEDGLPGTVGGPGKGDAYPGYTAYFIPKDKHDPTPNPVQLISKSALRFQVLFDSSCRYASKKPENQKDINKLYGFSDCASFHHENSARVGWLWNGKTIELYAYCYADSVRSSKLLGTLSVGVPAELGISVKGNQYIFDYAGRQTTMKRHCGGDTFSGYKLLPYFGGDETAPHDMWIYVREL